MNRKLIFLIVIFSANIDFVFADWPHVVRCPMIYSVAEPIGSSTGVERFEGRGTLVDEHTVAVDGENYSAEHILIATGGWPHVVRCPMIYSVAEPIGSSTMRNGFPHYSRSDCGLFVATGKSEKQYPAKKFIGADVKNYNTFSCNYEATDGTHVTTKFTISKCQPMAGFDISVKCNNPDPGQCLVMCAY